MGSRRLRDGEPRRAALRVVAHALRRDKQPTRLNAGGLVRSNDCSWSNKQKRPRFAIRASSRSRGAGGSAVGERQLRTSGMADESEDDESEEEESEGEESEGEETAMVVDRERYTGDSLAVDDLFAGEEEAEANYRPTQKMLASISLRCCQPRRPGQPGPTSLVSQVGVLRRRERAF